MSAHHIEIRFGPDSERWEWRVLGPLTREAHTDGWVQGLNYPAACVEALALLTMIQGDRPGAPVMFQTPQPWPLTEPKP